jgi:Tat-targeted selenate reductase subunit YnfH
MKLREWPLVLFTVLGQAAAGAALFLVLPLYIFPAWSAIRGVDALRVAGPAVVVILLGAAAIFSLFHLGRPQRAFKALAKSGSSWLSREVTAAMIFGIASAALAVLSWKMPRSAAATTLSVLVIAEAGAFLYSMARIYTIKAVPVWYSPATLAAFASTALVLGSLIGAIVSGVVGTPGLDQARFQAGLASAALITMGAAFVIAVLYAPRFGFLAKKEPFPVAPPERGLAIVQALRLVLLGLAVALVGFGAALVPALAAAFVSEILGRFVFYSLPSGF